MRHLLISLAICTTWPLSCKGPIISYCRVWTQLRPYQGEGSQVACRNFKMSRVGVLSRVHVAVGNWATYICPCNFNEMTKSSLCDFFPTSRWSRWRPSLLSETSDLPSLFYLFSDYSSRSFIYLDFIWALSLLFGPCRLSEFTLAGPQLSFWTRPTEYPIYPETKEHKKTARSNFVVNCLLATTKWLHHLRQVFKTMEQNIFYMARVWKKNLWIRVPHADSVDNVFSKRWKERKEPCPRLSVCNTCLMNAWNSCFELWIETITV